MVRFEVVSDFVLGMEDYMAIQADPSPRPITICTIVLSTPERAVSLGNKGTTFKFMLIFRSPGVNLGMSGCMSPSSLASYMIGL